MISFREPDAKQMKHMEHQIARTLAPFRENTEAALAIFALIRCARILLRKYPEATQEELMLVIVPFLAGKQPPAGVLSESGLLVM